jgi:hypothetical protein
MPQSADAYLHQTFLLIDGYEAERCKIRAAVPESKTLVTAQ